MELISEVAINNGKFTNTETKLLSTLSDGRLHARRELRLLIDEYAGYETLKNHISKIRKKLPPGEDIVCVARYRRLNYQHVRLLRAVD